MTSFCSQCGKQIRTGGKFCQSCGAAAVQSSPAQPNPPSGQQPGSGYTPGYPAGGYGGSSGYQSGFPAQQAMPHGAAPYEMPVQQKSGRTLKVVLITLAVLFLVIAGVAGVATMMIKRAVRNAVQVTEGKDGTGSVVVDIPGIPKISAGSGVSEAELGVPIYPGAEQEKDGTSSVSISGGADGARGWLGVATYKTEDSLDEVVAFYREKLAENTHIVESSGDGKRSAVFQLESPKGWRMVTVAEDDNSNFTKIVIASVSGKSAQ